VGVGSQETELTSKAALQQQRPESAWPSSAAPALTGEIRTLTEESMRVERELLMKNRSHRQVDFTSGTATV